MVAQDEERPIECKDAYLTLTLLDETFTRPKTQTSGGQAVKDRGNGRIIPLSTGRRPVRVGNFTNSHQRCPTEPSSWVHSAVDYSNPVALTLTAISNENAENDHLRKLLLPMATFGGCHSPRLRYEKRSAYCAEPLGTPRVYLRYRFGPCSGSIPGSNLT